MRSLQIEGEDLGIIHDKKAVGDARLWLTEKPDGTWWIVVDDPDRGMATMGLIRPPQEQRAREIYDSLNAPPVLVAFLEGRDS